MDSDEDENVGDMTLITSLIHYNDQIPLNVFADKISRCKLRDTRKLHTFVTQRRLDNRPITWHVINVADSDTLCDVCGDRKECDLKLVQLCSNGSQNLSLCSNGEKILRRLIQSCETWKELQKDMMITMNKCIVKWRSSKI